MIDMKIEEVIAHEKFKARIDRIKADKRLFPNNSEYEIFACNRSEAEHENIVLWLEELKELRATSCGYSKEDIELNRTAMYNKAIDDFASAFDKWIKSDTKSTYYWTEFQVEFMKIAEQLKAGGENEQSI